MVSIILSVCVFVFVHMSISSTLCFGRPIHRRQRDREFSGSDSQFSDLGFESRSDHYLDLFLGSPEFKSWATIVNSQRVCLRPAGILNNAMFDLNYLFYVFVLPH